MSGIHTNRLSFVFLSLTCLTWEGKGEMISPPPHLYKGFPGGASGKNTPLNAGDTRDRFDLWGGEDPLEEGMATHSRILAWRIPWTEEPGGLQSMGSQRVKHN